MSELSENERQKEKKVLTKKEKLDKRIKSKLKSILKILNDMETFGMKLRVEDEKYKNPTEVKKIVEDMLRTGNYSDFPVIEGVMK